LTGAKTEIQYEISKAYTRENITSLAKCIEFFSRRIVILKYTIKSSS